MLIGSASVSKADGSQSLDLQRDALSRKSRDLVRRVPLRGRRVRQDLGLHGRLLGPIGHVSPAEFEQQYYLVQEAPVIAAGVNL